MVEAVELLLKSIWSGQLEFQFKNRGSEQEILFPDGQQIAET